MRRNVFFLAVALLIAGATAIEASQPLETETARLLPAGMVKIETTFEWQTAREGRERAFPLVFEYGITPRVEFAVEPVAFTSIDPKLGSHARGRGDTEATLTWLAMRETSSSPALDLAAEWKFPTARNTLIGSGKSDATLWVIASKAVGRLDFHGNLGYTKIGRPGGAKLRNTIDYALAEEFHLNPRWDVVGEFVGHTSASPESGESSVPTSGAPELVGSENAVLAGIRWKWTPGLTLAGGVSYDSNHAVLIRTGVTFRFSLH